ncbi:MAG: RNA polymerase sigma factor [Oscillospiraceae bacterium]|nr:RNA polymerase sigma factor [Oscillospiraceae bacterium]
MRGGGAAVDDEAIIGLFFARDERAIRETELKYGRQLTALAQRITGSPQDAEECLSDVMLRTWNAIPPAKPQNLFAYLVSAVRNTAINLAVRMKAEKRGGKQMRLALEELSESLPASDDVEAACSEAEAAEQLRRFTATLPPETRRMFILRYVYLLSVKEIAEKTGAGVSKVKVTLHRTRRALKEYLGGEEL